MTDWESTPATEGLTEMASDHTNKPGPPRDLEGAKKAQEKGWVEQTNIDYAAMSAPPAAPAALSAEVPVPQWAHNAAKYEWREDFGDVAPAMPELEAELFGSELRLKKGIQFEQLNNIKVIVEGVTQVQPVLSFANMGLHPVMLSNCQKMGYDVPTPIQAYTIPAVLQGNDIVGIAQTGSGKTGAFMVPILSKLMGKIKKLGGPRVFPGNENGLQRVRAEPLVLVVAPTRELCIQIFDEARRLCYRSLLRPCVAYGGGPIREQRDDLRRGCDVLIATPGRLIDFMRDADLLSMGRLRYTVVDEADEMLHEDWQEELKEILSGANTSTDDQHQYLLFSATFDKRLRVVAKRYLRQDYVRIRIGRTGSTVKSISQQIIWVDGNKKREAAYDLLISQPPARTLIFVKSKKMVDILDDYLFNRGLPTTSIHSDRTQMEREDAMRSFRNGKCPILIITGVGSRGLDIKNVMHVINYDLPSIEHNGKDEYIHRIGRTGRLGNLGMATSFYNENDEPLAPFLVALLIENGHEVPDFLEQYKPTEDQPLTAVFDDDSADEIDDFNPEGEANNEGQGEEDGWGAGDDAPVPAPADAPQAEAWGATVTSGGDASW